MGASFKNFIFFWRSANCISIVLLTVMFLFFGKIKWWWWCVNGLIGHEMALTIIQQNNQIARTEM